MKIRDFVSHVEDVWVVVAVYENGDEETPALYCEWDGDIPHEVLELNLGTVTIEEDTAAPDKGPYILIVVELDED